LPPIKARDDTFFFGKELLSFQIDEEFCKDYGEKIPRFSCFAEVGEAVGNQQCVPNYEYVMTI